MIRINLLGGERQKAKSAARFDASQQVVAMSGLVAAAAVAGIGFWYWSLSSTASSLDAQVTTLTREAKRLDTVLAEVKAFEDRKANIQQRVALIERLRQGQTVPVQLLDHVSRSLPEMLWLTDMAQTGNALTIEGQSTTLIALSDFVGNLGTNPLLIKPIEIVNSEVDTSSSAAQARPGQPAVETIRFTVKAHVAGVASKGLGGSGAAPARK